MSKCLFNCVYINEINDPAGAIPWQLAQNDPTGGHTLATSPQEDVNRTFRLHYNSSLSASAVCTGMTSDLALGSSHVTSHICDASVAVSEHGSAQQATEKEISTCPQARGRHTQHADQYNDEQ